MVKGFNIQATKHYTLIAISLLLLLQLSVKGQPEVIFGNSYFCENSAVDVPMLVNNFNEVTTFTLIIQFDQQSLDFIEVRNPHQYLLNGNLMWEYLQTDQSHIVITWINGTEPLNLDNAPLLSLHFNYSEGLAHVGFSEGCEISVDLTPQHDALYLDGYVSSLQIVSQPYNQSVSVNERVTFTIGIEGEADFSWEENPGDGWYPLVENGFHYSGTSTNQLQITDVPDSFNARQYRCIVQSDECIIISDAAVLTVSSTSVHDQLPNRYALHVFPNPFRDKFYFSVKAAGNYVLELVNFNGEIVQKIDLLGMHESDAEAVNFTGRQPGIYFLNLYREGIMLSRTKLLKQ